ncbi:TPA: hypothetical protein ACNVCI_000572 [Citrobacter braakii]|uniref:hypothetical protein n=1 Tax=Citrobacter braakii TaxID=57706 RepID=UPI003AFD1E59
MNKNLLVNFPRNGGVKQFSDWLAKKSNGNFDYYQFNSYQELKTVLKKNNYKTIIFGNNNINIYKLLLGGYLKSLKLILILHDHKIRKDASFKEVVLIKLFNLFKNKFYKIIVHSKNHSMKGNSSHYLKMPFHYEENNDINKKIRLLQFGRIDSYKNIEGLIEIVSNDPMFELIIAGSGEISNEVKLSIQKSKNITLINQYINAEISDVLFKWCDFLCLYYLDITQTGLIDYASKYKKGVLVSDIKDFEDIANQYTHFVSVMPLDKKEARVSLLRLAETFDDNMRANIAFEAEENYIQSNQAWEKYVDELCK